MAVTALGEEILAKLCHDQRAGSQPVVLDDVSERIERKPRTAGESLTEDEGLWVGSLRRIGAAVLSRWGLPDLMDDAQLLISELVTNALRYGTGREVIFRMLLGTDALVLEVNDGSTGRPQVRPAGPTEESGRGMWLVSAIATSWGVSEDETTTWCALKATAKEPDITTQPSPSPGAAVTETRGRPVQPAPWSTPGTWTITTVNGVQTSGYLPAWAEDDPSEVGVPLEMLGVRLADVSHRSFFEGQIIDVVAPDAHGKAEEEAVFEASIDCTPYAEDPEPRVPVVDIHAYPEHWILGLDPAGVTEVAAKLRAQADRLDHEVRPALIAAREDWAAHHPTWQ
jgi:anti-sigma regulatory factor (Ser/Thr protein kinase)